MASFLFNVNKVFQAMLSDTVRERSERIVVGIAIVTFVVHLLLIFVSELGWLDLRKYTDLLDSPVSALYTPFSFILIYEVYLLVFYLPQSMTSYIGKQYEIITLIVIRRIFKDISKMNLSDSWWHEGDNLQLGLDIVSTIILFLLIYTFYRVNQQRTHDFDEVDENRSIRRFIRTKKVVSVLLVPVILGLAVYSLTSWVRASFFSVGQVLHSIQDINQIFFDEFFTILIITDVVLLLFSFIHTNYFHKVIRNSGFIISTVLLKLSFSAGGLLNNVLILGAVIFGTLILFIHNLYERQEGIREEASEKAD